MKTKNLAANFDNAVEQFVEYISITFDTAFNVISDMIEGVLNGIEALFLFPPFYLFIIFLGILAWKTAGKGMALFTVVGFYLCHAMNLWDETMITMALVVTSVIFTLIVAIPLGVVAGSNRKVSDVTRVLMDFLQTMPPYVYLIPAIAILGFGASPAVVSTSIVAFAPAVRLTSLGIRQVPLAHVEVGQAFGATPAQALFKIKLPFALPSIMAGVNQSLMLALSMAVIAGIIGAGGLGKEVYRAIRVLEVGKAFDAGISIVILAIILDRISQGAVNMMTKEGN
ncbi:glycine betaine/proline transport system permease protein [Desulfocicer vacuolatum DSM 3385]|uniref:Glycine betaine/proline transport system permease protein n=1 Tax=Desulfocicer vacuolatum DSM 3385 TaxID=1121400 RepID=A0A1W2ATU0_9BACT|nr:ABC transporter permease subunit [Desulfocicer vacuolatum]SMC64159.1 glycine betaine/proline transport system permease protein [Desulfocicer vacuolatum DSM 3385]